MILFGIPWVDTIALLWQVLAAVAIGGIVIVVIFAIIEPGPLVKRRPFPRKGRTEQADAEPEDSEPPGARD